MEHESSGMWKLWTVEALDRLPHGSSQQWKSCTMEELGRGNPGPWKLWIVEALGHLDRSSPEQWKPLKLRAMEAVEAVGVLSNGSFGLWKNSIVQTPDHGSHGG